MNKARLRSMLKDITEQLNQLSREELRAEINACPTFHIILERIGIIEPEPKVESKSCDNCGKATFLRLEKAPTGEIKIIGCSIYGEEYPAQGYICKGKYWTHSESKEVEK